MIQNELPLPSEGESKVDLFRKKEVRKTLHDNEWWFSVKDVVEALVDTPNGTHYIRTVRSRDPGLQEWWAQNVLGLPFISKRGVFQNTLFVNIEGIFRLIQSIPSPKVEPFKKWIAKTAFERLQEIQNPELAVKRAIALYQAKGYDNGWIDARIRNTVSRKELTDEWKARGIEGVDYAILTDAIAIQTFGVSTKEHQELKGLKSQSLRDNMTPIELTLTTLGEQTTTQIARVKNAQGRKQNLEAALRGGQVAGTARKDIEAATGVPVVSTENFLTAKQRANNSKGMPNFDEIITRLLPQGTS